MDQSRIRNFSIIAHIDHGKSTLADRILELTDTRLRAARCASRCSTRWSSSASAGSRSRRRRCASHWKGHELNLIDTPGHVDFTYEVSRSLQACEGAVLVVDAAQGIEAQTLANAYLAIENDLEIVPVVNKIDLPQADPDGAAAEVAELLGGDAGATSLRISAKTGAGRRGRCSTRSSSGSRRPTASPTRRARALDLRLVVRPVPRRGRVRPRRRRRASRRGERAARDGAWAPRFEAEELGFLSPTHAPGRRARRRARSATSITGLKDVSRLRVGDTLTTARRGAAPSRCPGYKDVKPMVFAGLFPTDSDDYPELRDALERLKLNDAALFYEPETSQALGFGFRCGFLGLLHMEIVRERLEREFDLDLLVTAPNVAYRVHERRTATGSRCTTRPRCRASSRRSRSRTSSASIIVPKEYVGAVMELNNERRGRFDHMEYLSEERVLLTYELPLGEIVLDFYDQLKSRTRGYASFDYDLAGFRDGELVAGRRARRRRAGRRALADRPPRRCVRRAASCSSSGCARRSRGRCSTSRSRRRSARA